MSPLMAYLYDEDLLVEVLVVYTLGRQLVAEGASGEVMGRYREWRDEVLASAQVLEVVSQDLGGGVRPTNVHDGIAQLNGHQHSLRLVASGEKDAATEEPYRGDHFAEVGAGV